MSVEVAFQRLKETGKAPDRLEQNSVEFFNRVREGFKSWARLCSKRICLVNSEKPIEEIFEVVRDDMYNCYMTNEKK